MRNNELDIYDKPVSTLEQKRDNKKMYLKTGALNNISKTKFRITTKNKIKVSNNN